MEIVGLDLLENKETKVGSSSSGALVKCGDELVFYERSSNAPTYPNKLALFGGKIEEGEDHTRALIREMGEEIKLDDGTNLKIDEDQVRYLGLLDAGDDRDHEKHISLVEVPKGLKEKMVLGDEGVRLVFVSMDSFPDASKFVPDLKTLVFDNRNVLKKWVEKGSILAGDLNLTERRVNRV